MVSEPACQSALNSGSTIGVTSEDGSDGAFHQEKTHLTEAGRGTVIVEPL